MNRPDNTKNFSDRWLGNKKRAGLDPARQRKNEA
jgi:hypothetical protein